MKAFGLENNMRGILVRRANFALLLSACGVLCATRTQQRYMGSLITGFKAQFLRVQGFQRVLSLIVRYVNVLDA